MPAPELRVALPAPALELIPSWIASEHFNSECPPALLSGAYRSVLVRIERHTTTPSSSFRIARDVAAPFVAVALSAFDEHALAGRRPSEGLHAFASIVLCLHEAVMRSGGRPHQVDPVEAYEANERAKATRERSTITRTTDYAHEIAAAELGVKKKALLEAAKRGKSVVKMMAEASIAATPRDKGKS